MKIVSLVRVLLRIGVRIVIVVLTGVTHGLKVLVLVNISVAEAPPTVAVVVIRVVVAVIS